ncbi:twk-11, partial [Pristionchus pacificus]
DSHQSSRSDPPVLSSFLITVAVILLSAAIFCIWEDWDFFTSVYFFVISLSTIGLGDVTPDHPEYMALAVVNVFIGLAMVTVFIDVVKEKIEMMYMDLLEKELERYMQRVDAGDPRATEQMMEQLQSKSKFLFPLMSKNSGNKVMEQFKKEARERGIEIPAILTDINPETGLPAFASVNKEDFKDMIEQAEERREKEEQKEKEIQQKIESRKVSARTPLGSDFNVSSTPLIHENIQQSVCILPTRPNDLMRTQSQPLFLAAIGVQTSVDVSFLDQFSFGNQFGPSTLDCECQTYICESRDEGIQTWTSTEDIYTQIEMIDRLLFEGRSEISTSVQAVPIFVTTGIQPEVSSIFSGGIDSSNEDEDEAEDDGVEEVEEWVTDEEDLEKQIREKIDKLHPKEHTTQEQRETLVRRHIQLFEKQNKSEDDNKGSMKDLSSIEKKDKKDIDVKEGSTRKLRELFERTGSASSSFASPSTKRKEGITVEEKTTFDVDRSEDKSNETKMEGTLEKRKTTKKAKCDTQSETKRKDKKMKTDDVDLSENNERLHLYSGSDSYDEGRNRSHSYHSDTSIASMSSTEFLMHAGTLQRRKDSESRKESERKRAEERRNKLEREISIEGGNTSLDEIETLKDIKKKLIKKTMLTKKRSSQDSEISLHRKMSKEEEKAERRKQRSELRFLKNIGLQTDLNDHTSSKFSAAITTQTHGMKKASRRSQTKLTSIDKPSTAALQHPLSIRRKISSIDPSRLSIISSEIPSSPIDLLDISSHGLRDLSLSPIPSEGQFDGDFEGRDIERPMKLEMNMERREEKRKSSEVVKRMRRRRKNIDVSTSETVRQSISSASSISSLLSPEKNITFDENGVRVAEVSIDVYLFNGQLDQSGYQFIVDPIERRKEDKNEDRSLLSTDGIKRIEVHYDWEEEELEDEEDEMIRKGGIEIVGEEDEVEAWCLVAGTQTEWEVEERGIQIRSFEIEGVSREWGTQSDERNEETCSPFENRVISTEIELQTSQKLTTDKETQSSLETDHPIVAMVDSNTQTEEYQPKKDGIGTSEEMCQTDFVSSSFDFPKEVVESSFQTEQMSPSFRVTESISSCAQTENVTPLLESQPCLVEESTQSDQIVPLEKSIEDEVCQTDENEIKSVDELTQTEDLTEERSNIQKDTVKEVKECESQCEILKGSNDIPTQTDSVDEEELIKETKETQSDSQERSDISIQTEMEEERIEKEHVEMIHQETQPEYSDRNSVEIQTELEDWKNEGKEPTRISSLEMESQTYYELKHDQIKEEKETQSDHISASDFEVQTEEEEEKSTREQGIQFESSRSIEIECQTDGETKHMTEKGTNPESSSTIDLETQTDKSEEKEEMFDRDCQTNEKEEDKEDNSTQSHSSFFHRIDQECQYLANTVEEKESQTVVNEGEKEDESTQSEYSLFNRIDQESQYFTDTVETSTQFDKVEKEDKESRTDFDVDEGNEKEDAAICTEEISTCEMGIETEFPSLATTSSQSTVTLNSGIQHKKVEKEVKECQTDRELLREINCSAQTCSAPPSPPPFPVRFTVIDASTQSISPLVTTSQTQYSSSCIRETSVQTDLNEVISAESQVDPFDISPLSSSFLSLANMIDVGIQTGVLARVEHMYANESKPEIIRGIAELHRSDSQDSDVSSIYRGPSSVRVSPAMVGCDRRDSIESIERRQSTSSPSQHLSTGNISSLRSRFETSSPLSPSTSKEKIAVSATTEKTKVKKVVTKKKNSEE